MNWKPLLLSSSLLASTLAWAQPTPPPGPYPPPVAPVPPVPPVPPMPPHGFMHGPGFRMSGIPPQVAKRLGIPPETVKKVQDATFESNEALIGLEADLKRAQLGLEKVMSQSAVDEGQVMTRLDGVGKAELAVRKNRMLLMLKIRKLLGQETWEKLQAEMPGPEPMMGFGGPGMRKEVRVIRTGDGTQTTEVNE